MAARRKTTAKKTRARSERARAEQEQRRRSRAAQKGWETRRAQERAEEATRRKRARAAKRGWEARRAREEAERREREREQRRRAAAKKKAAAARVGPTAAQQAAITRATNAFMALPRVRPYTRLIVVELYERRRTELVDALTRAGYNERQIRARLGWLTRRRKELDRWIYDEVRLPLLGRRAGFTGRDPDQRRELATLMEERDQRFLDFIDALDEVGVGYDEAVNYWFSP